MSHTRKGSIYMLALNNLRSIMHRVAVTAGRSRADVDISGLEVLPIAEKIHFLIKNID